MIKINQLKLKVSSNKQQLKKKIVSFLKISPNDLISYKIERRSIDARKKPDLYYSYSVLVDVRQEDAVLRRFRGKENLVCAYQEADYCFPIDMYTGKVRPIIIGMGPAGLFCAYYLALHGFRPILLERGKSVEERTKDVLQFWSTGVLIPESNVQFGEGGAGTFSDGKLNTLVKDKTHRNQAVLDTFIRFGADESIGYDAKPHIGTDKLQDVVRNIRNEVIRLGGEVHFQSKVTSFILEDHAIKGVMVNDNTPYMSDKVVLAIGHSARDTFAMLYDLGITMEQKAFAVGFRVEHLQSKMNQALYGLSESSLIGAASYKVTAKASSGRGVYSFCMCPGGYVVNASSEEGRLAVNGMSYSGRDGKNANSAIVITVDPSEYPSDHPLAGIAFQRALEEKAYRLGKGCIPVQRYGNFKAILDGEQPQVKDEGDLMPSIKGKYNWSDLTELFTPSMSQDFVDGMESFAKQITGFNDPDTILSGVESRTSSPVRITRSEDGVSSIRGLYPCGEGAGYAGGITSAAMDGIRIAERIAIDCTKEIQ